jgi:hypothetical protein
LKKTTYRALLGSALVLQLSAGVALANETMEQGTQIACTEVKYSSEFLAKYPQAPRVPEQCRPHDG